MTNEHVPDGATDSDRVEERCIAKALKETNCREDTERIHWIQTIVAN